MKTATFTLLLIIALVVLSGRSTPVAAYAIEETACRDEFGLTTPWMTTGGMAQSALCNMGGQSGPITCWRDSGNSITRYETYLVCPN